MNGDGEIKRGAVFVRKRVELLRAVRLPRRACEHHRDSCRKPNSPDHLKTVAELPSVAGTSVTNKAGINLHGGPIKHDLHAAPGSVWSVDDLANCWRRLHLTRR